MNTPTIRLILAGHYDRPYIVMQYGNAKTRLESNDYSTRSKAKRARRAMGKILEEFPGAKILVMDETVRP